jgi:hypothetical protein
MKKYYKCKEKRNFVTRTKVKKAGWFVHILSRNCLLKQVIEGIEERSNRNTRK